MSHKKFFKNVFLDKVIETSIMSVIFKQGCVCSKRGNPPKFVVEKMDIVGEGGCITLHGRCSLCNDAFTFESDPSKTAKYELAVAFKLAGIPFSKYRRWGFSIGRTDFTKLSSASLVHLINLVFNYIISS